MRLTPVSSHKDRISSQGSGHSTILHLCTGAVHLPARFACLCENTNKSRTTDQEFERLFAATLHLGGLCNTHSLRYHKRNCIQFGVRLFIVSPDFGQCCIEIDQEYEMRSPA